MIISTRETAVKTRNLRRNPLASLCVFTDAFFGRWVQVEGSAEVVSLPEAMEFLVEYYRLVSGEHPDWDDYRAAMVRDRRCLIRIEITRAGPDISGQAVPRHDTSAPGTANFLPGAAMTARDGIVCRPAGSAGPAAAASHRRHAESAPRPRLTAGDRPPAKPNGATVAKIDPARVALTALRVPVEQPSCSCHVWPDFAEWRFRT